MNKFLHRKRKAFLLVCVTSLLGICFGATMAWCSFREYSVQKKNSENIIRLQAIAKAGNPEFPDTSSVDQILRLMTIEEKIGQMFILGFDGIEPNSHITSAIKDKKIGGVILYDRNMKTPRQVSTLNNALKRIVAEQRLGIPLFICIDQEGGVVTRMEERVAAAPSQKKQGTQSERAGVYSISSVTAKELSSMGFSVNFAPVLDLSESDSRSFGTIPSKVALLGKAAVDAHNDAGIIAAIKHFPGLGRSKVDTHFDFDVVNASFETLEKSDIVPFAYLMKSTEHKNFMVMMTHLIFTAFDSKNPSSVSPAVVKGLLREKMGFSGLVVTDDMEMGGLTKIVSYEAMGVKAVEAGVDIMLVCQKKENQDKVYQGLVNAVKAGKISETRINESVRRILIAKQAYHETLYRIVDVDEAERIVGSPLHKEIMKNLGRIAIDSRR